MQVVAVVVEQTTAPRMMATYPVTAEPPSETGGDHDTVPPPGTGATVTEVGAPGFLILGVLAPAGAEAAALVRRGQVRSGADEVHVYAGGFSMSRGLLGPGHRLRSFRVGWTPLGAGG